MDAEEALRIVQELGQEAETALAGRDWERALEIADQLERLQHVALYEVRARALWGQGRRSEALLGLAEGLRRVPRHGPMWLLLGALQAEVERFEEAEASLRNGMRCPEADPAAIGYQLALLRLREGRVEEALALLEPLDDLPTPALDLEPVLLRVRILGQLGRHAEGVELVDRVLERSPPIAEGPEAVRLAALLVERAKARWLGAGDREGALEDARAALALSPQREGELEWLAGLGPD